MSGRKVRIYSWDVGEIMGKNGGKRGGKRRFLIKQRGGIHEDYFIDVWFGQTKGEEMEV